MNHETVTLTYDDIKKREQDNYLIAFFMSKSKDWQFRYTKDENYHFFDTPFSSIADEYVGIEKTGRKIKIPTCNFNFHNNWVWLMQVVERIEALKVKATTWTSIDPKAKVEAYFTLEICGTQCIINYDIYPQYGGTTTNFLETYDCRNTSKMESTYKACVEFITWYNKPGKKHL